MWCVQLFFSFFFFHPAAAPRGASFADDEPLRLTEHRSLPQTGKLKEKSIYVIMKRARGEGEERFLCAEFNKLIVTCRYPASKESIVAREYIKGVDVAFTSTRVSTSTMSPCCHRKGGWEGEGRDGSPSLGIQGFDDRP